MKHIVLLVVLSVAWCGPVSAGTLRVESSSGGSAVPSGTVQLPAEVSITPDEGFRLDWYVLDGDIVYAGSRKAAQGVTVNIPDSMGFHSLRAHFTVNPSLMVVTNRVEGRGRVDLPEKMVLPAKEWFDFSLDAGRGFHFFGLEILRNTTKGRMERTFLNADQYFISVCNSGMSYCAASNAGRRFAELPNGLLVFRWFFVPDPVISATHGIGGDIEPDGLVWLPYRSRKAFTITPAPGYVVKDVLVDGKSFGPQTSLIMKFISENHDIHAVFAPAEKK